jgi:hypothetical protein
MFGAVRTAQAFEFPEGNSIPAGTVIDDDVFISGDTVTVDGTINGVLFANGGTVTINGTVNGDLFINAAVATVNGPVNGNLMISGQTLLLNSAVQGSVFAGGTEFKLSPTASVGRNLYVGGFGRERQPGTRGAHDRASGGYQVLLAGQVERNVAASASAFEMTGQVGSDITVDVEAPAQPGAPNFFDFFKFPGMPATVVPPGLRIAPQAEVGGQLTYLSPAEQAAGIQATPGGGIVFKYKEPPSAMKQVNVGDWILARLRELITLTALGGLVLWLLPKALPQGVEQLRRKPLASLGKGLLVLLLGLFCMGLAFFVILAVGILLGIVTLGGLQNTVFGFGFSSLGLLSAIFWLMVNYGSKLLVASWWEAGSSSSLQRPTAGTLSGRF